MVMTTSADAGADPPARLAGSDGTWPRVARLAGTVAGACFFGQTLLFLADETSLLADTPEYTETAAGRAHDLATYYLEYFEYQHTILWDIALRDTLGPIGYLALMVLGLAVLNVVGHRRAEAQLLALFFAVGGLLAALTDLIYLSTTTYWRNDGWEATPTENMIAVGRAVEAINTVTTYPQYGGLVVLALGLVCVGRLCRHDAALSSWLGNLAYVEALALAGFVVGSVAENNTATNLLALVTGALLAPVVTVWLGRDVARYRQEPSGRRSR
jgi:hypothetical protein